MKRKWRLLLASAILLLVLVPLALRAEQERLRSQILGAWREVDVDADNKFQSAANKSTTLDIYARDREQFSGFAKGNMEGPINFRFVDSNLIQFTHSAPGYANTPEGTWRVHINLLGSALSIEPSDSAPASDPPEYRALPDRLVRIQ